MAYSISSEPQETQLESSRFLHPTPYPPSLRYKQRKPETEKKPLSQDSSHSADSIIQRYPLQQHVFLRSHVHRGEGKKENIAYIPQTAGHEVDCCLCVAIVKKNYTTGLTDINILLNFLTFHQDCVFIFFPAVLCVESWCHFLGMANSKPAVTYVEGFFLLCNSAHNICGILNSPTTDVENYDLCGTEYAATKISVHIYIRDNQWQPRLIMFWGRKAHWFFYFLISSIYRLHAQCETKRKEIKEFAQSHSGLCLKK